MLELDDSASAGRWTGPAQHASFESAASLETALTVASFAAAGLGQIGSASPGLVWI